MKLFGQHVWCSGESLWLLHSSNLFSEAHICSDVTTVHLLDSSGNLFNPRTLTYIFVTPSLTLGVFYPKNYFSSTYIITQQYMIKWSNFLLFPSIKFLIKQKKYHGGVEDSSVWSPFQIAVLSIQHLSMSASCLNVLFFHNRTKQHSLISLNAAQVWTAALAWVDRWAQQWS